MNGLSYEDASGLKVRSWWLPIKSVETSSSSCSLADAAAAAAAETLQGKPPSKALGPVQTDCCVAEAPAAAAASAAAAAAVTLHAASAAA